MGGSPSFSSDVAIAVSESPQRPAANRLLLKGFARYHEMLEHTEPRHRTRSVFDPEPSQLLRSREKERPFRVSHPSIHLIYDSEN
ncbi:MAG: hypothetical protein JWM55_1832 [Acidimicrobiaceae bacterium]|nr:hypothetical protein [Acidimicrobiaceae bacterium]